MSTIQYDVAGTDIGAEIERITALGHVIRDTIDADPELGNRRLMTIVGKGEPCEAYDLVVYEETKHRSSSMRVTVRPVTDGVMSLTDILAAAEESGGLYIGSLFPALGSAMWDPEEDVWAVRVRVEDEPFSCGLDCCGTAAYAVVAVRPTIHHDTPAKGLIRMS